MEFCSVEKKPGFRLAGDAVLQQQGGATTLAVRMPTF